MPLFCRLAKTGSTVGMWRLPCGTIKLPAHAFGGRVLASARLGYPLMVLDDHELALDGAIWIAQALGSKRTVSAGGDGCLEVSNAVAIEEHILAALVELVARGTETLRLALVVRKVLQSKQTALLLCACLTLLTTEQAALFLDPFLVSCRVGKRRLALTVVAVSDVHVRASLFDRVDHGFAMETAICGYLGAPEDVSASLHGAKSLARCLDDRREQMPLVA